MVTLLVKGVLLLFLIIVFGPQYSLADVIPGDVIDIDLKAVKDNPHPAEIKGFPFPEPDINDPTLPMQIYHNFNQIDFSAFSVHEIQLRKV